LGPWALWHFRWPIEAPAGGQGVVLVSGPTCVGLLRSKSPRLCFLLFRTKPEGSWPSPTLRPSSRRSSTSQSKSAALTLVLARSFLFLSCSSCSLLAFLPSPWCSRHCFTAGADSWISIYRLPSSFVFGVAPVCGVEVVPLDGVLPSPMSPSSPLAPPLEPVCLCGSCVGVATHGFGCGRAWSLD
jgi:hypothetical protein